MPGSLPTVAWCLASAAIAADAVPPGADMATDVRFVYALAGDRYEIRSSGGDRSGAWDRSEHLRLQVLRSQVAPFGLGGGVSLASTRKAEDRAGEHLSLEAVSGRVDLAVAAAPADGVRIEMAPFAGYGLSEFAAYPAPAVGGGYARDRDGFVEYGLNLNAVVTTQGGIQVGGGVGYWVQESEYDLKAAGDPRVESSGPVYSVFIGTRH